MAISLGEILKAIAGVRAEQFDTLSDLQVNIALAQKLGRLVQAPAHCEIEVIGDTLHYYGQRPTTYSPCELSRGL